jgi:hypothetical protein
MPTRLLVEGADIESVLAQLREDHGPDARIVQAELVRIGGVGGFFAKRRYEVTVEVDDQAPAAAAGSQASPLTPASAPAPATPLTLPAAAARPQTFEDLLDAVSDQADFAPSLLATAPVMSPVMSPLMAAPSAAAEPPIEELATPAFPHGWHRPVSTQGTAFTDVLDTLTRNLGSAAPAPAAVATIAPERAPEPAVVPAAVAAELPAVPMTSADFSKAFGLAAPAAPGAPFTPPFTPPAVPALAPMPAQASVPTPTPAPAPTPAPPARNVVRTLATLGVPEQLSSTLRSTEPVLALHELFTSLPEPRLPRWRPSATRGGALFVLVGEWQTARDTARSILRELGADQDALLAVGATPGLDLPADQSVRSHRAALALVEQARRVHDVLVLVIDPGPARQSAARAAATIAALEPQGVMVCADATRDLDVCLGILDDLDREDVDVHGLVLDGAARSRRPAAALEIPVPVIWVDGRPATCGAWLGICVDRLGPKC